MEIPSTALIGIGAILAAFVSGVFSYINLVIGKDQKTSEFRQQWIDAIRNEISEFISLAINLKDAARIYKLEANINNNPAEFSKIHNTIKDDINKLGMAHIRIKLRLNRIKNIGTISRLTEFYSMANSSNVNSEQLNVKANELILEFQDVLKTEWERVKSGELAYRVTKYVALLFVLVTISFLVMIVFFGGMPALPSVHIKY